MSTIVIATLTVVASFLGRFAGLFSFALSPIGTVVSAACSVVVSVASSPLGRVVIVTLFLVTLVVGAYFVGVVKGSKAEHAALTVQYQKDIADANARADAARAEADKKFISGKFNPHPSRIIPGRVRKGTDGFSRD